MRRAHEPARPRVSVRDDLLVVHDGEVGPGGLVSAEPLFHVRRNLHDARRLHGVVVRDAVLQMGVARRATHDAFALRAHPPERVRDVLLERAPVRGQHHVRAALVQDVAQTIHLVLLEVDLGRGGGAVQHAVDVEEQKRHLARILSGGAG